MAERLAVWRKPLYSTLLAALLLASSPVGASEWAAVRRIEIIGDSGSKNVRSYQAAFDAVGFTPSILRQPGPKSSDDRILVVPQETAQHLSPGEVQKLAGSVRDGALLITEGDSPLSRELGVRFAGSVVSTVGVRHAKFSDVEIRWEQASSPPVFQAPAGGQVLARGLPSNQPIEVVFPAGRGTCFFLGAELDPVSGEGYLRFPYFIHDLEHAAGLTLPFRGSGLESFFDYGARSSVDVDYFARKWRSYGIRAIHVGAWHFLDRERDDYLRDLIAACHRNGILVYAWLPLPEVSHKFWVDHPQWREKNAFLEDAPALWREPVDLADPDCFREAAERIRKLLLDFDWDGANLCELYFEGYEGAQKPFEFTPLNNLVRAEFKRRTGLDPADFFKDGATNWHNSPLWPQFVNYRVDLIVQLHEKVLGLFDEVRRSKPYLDLVVVQIDNLYEPFMREACAADIQRLMALVPRFHFTLFAEDPARIWHLGPARYQEIAGLYSTKAPAGTPLGIDLNIVDRLGTAYPTSKQTGIETLRLFHYASVSFPRVLLYIESTMRSQDLEAVAHSMAGTPKIDASGDSMTVTSARAITVALGNPRNVLVDGHPSAFLNGSSVMLPAGKHVVSRSTAPTVDTTIRIPWLNAEPLHGSVSRDTIEFSYRSGTRAYAVFSARPASVTVDGKEYREPLLENYGEWTLRLPPGKHDVVLRSGGSSTR